MARLKGPLMSIDAKGKFANSMVFDGIPGIPRVRKKVDPKQPNSAGQLQMRNFFRMLHNRWTFLSIYTKDNWDESIKNKYNAMSGYNYYSQSYINSMKSGQTPLTMPTNFDFITLRYSFNLSGGSVAVDSSLYNNNGTINGTIIRIAGVDGNAIRLTTSSDYISIPDSVSLYPTINNKLTLECWFRMSAFKSPAGWENFFAKSWSDYALRFYPSNTFSFVIRAKGTGVQTTLNLLYTPTFNKWTHLVGTFDGSFMRIYIDGILKKTGSAPGITVYQRHDLLKIGQSNDSNSNFIGDLDEVSIYNIALSDSEILRHYNMIK